MRQHIDLDRRFREVAPDRDPELAALESYAAELHGREPGLGWSDLLGHPRVVILGEPGSGKTHELLHQAQSKRDDDRTTFFVPLDRLVSEPLDAVLDLEDRERLRRWLRVSTSGHFFLDSVDESKRVREKDFLTALDRVRDGLGRALGRAGIVISSRISDWRPRTDKAEVDTRLRGPFPTSRGEAATTEALVVQIEPLDRKRVERFADGLGLDDPAGFSRALDDHHAWPFARRPIDVKALIGYWQQHGKLGSLHELVEFDLDRTLAETIERAREDPLTPHQARQGAMALGAAVAFCRRLDFRVPDDMAAADSEAMDPSACLPGDWRAGEQRALMSRAVFDGATFGRIRFHHRRVAEYLAAKWIEERMRDGCPLETLEELLFDRSVDPPIARPALGPVTAWLACGDGEWNRFVRQWVLECAPTLFLQHGDPEALPAEYRAQLLRELTIRFAARANVWLQTEPEALARIADPSLSSVIHELVADKKLPPDLRKIPLQVVRHGGLACCVDVALEVLADPSEPDDLKHYAAAAVRDAGTVENKAKLAEIARTWAQVDHTLCAIVCEAIYPAGDGPEGLLHLLSKVPEVPHLSPTLPHALGRLLQEAMQPDHQVAVLDGLVALARRPPHIHSGGEDLAISARFYWAGDVALTVAAAILSAAQVTAGAAASAARALTALWRHRHLCEYHPLGGDPIPDALRRHPGVVRALAWQRVEDLRRADPGAVPRCWEVFEEHDLYQPGHQDFEWLCDDIQTREQVEDRFVALCLALEIWTRCGWSWTWRRRLRRAACRDPGLRRELRPLGVWAGLGRFRRRLWARHVSYKLASGWWWQRRLEPAHGLWRWLLDEWWLVRHLRPLAAGEATLALGQLASEAASDEHGSKWAVGSWEGLRRRRGRLIVGVVRKGCKRAWRRYQPALPHEKAKRSQTDHRVIVGLSGIAAAIQDGDLQLSSVSVEDALLATRYAVNELNGFPTWLFDLASSRPDQVRGVLMQCVQGEWSLPTSDERVQGVLAGIRSSGGELPSLVAGAVLGDLSAQEPTHTSVLEDALALLLQLPSPPLAMLGQLASARVGTCPPGDQRHYLWLAIWLQTECGPALDHLQGILDHHGDPSGYLTAFSSTLWPLHAPAPVFRRAAHLSPASVGRLIRMFHRHVRPADDVTHDGAYSPTARDEAQEFRDRLLPLLASSEDPGADSELRALLEEPDLAHLRDWILHLLDERRDRAADQRPWQPREIREFAATFEIDPRTDRDLFAIALRRLSDIRNSVERADISARPDLRPEDHEDRLRSWLARQLRERSRAKYNVPQESEIDPRRYPDLRIEAPGLPPVPIEVKWACSWTGPDLFERLENQLIGDYLRAHDAHYGVYLLGRIGEPKEWQHPTAGHLMGFLALLEALQAHATAIVDARPDVREVRVVGIDFSEP